MLQSEFYKGRLIFRTLFVAGMIGSASVSGEIPLGENGKDLNQHVIESRGKPLPEIETLHVLNASAFGAVPDDGKDDRAAIQAAIDAAIAAGPGSTVELKPGRYHLEGGVSDKPGEYLLEIGGASGLTLRGNGAEWIVRAPRSGALRIKDSDGVTLESLVIDYDPLPFTVGRIVEVDRPGDAITVEALPGYPTPVDPLFDNVHGWGYFLDPDVPGKLGYRMPNVVFDEERTDLGNNLFRIRFKKGTGSQMDAVVPGVFYTRIVKVAQLFIAHHSRNLVFRDITSYASPAGHYVGTDLENVLIENCRLLIRDGRLKGGNADGVHLQNARGPIVIRNCTMEGISDDCVNLYQHPHYIIAYKNGQEWSFSSYPDRSQRRKGAGNLKAGDLLHAYDPSTGLDYGRAELKAYDPDSGQALFAAAWDLPQDPEVWKHLLIYSDGFGSDVRIEDNTFAHSRRYGLYLKSHRARVAGNRFIGLSGSALFCANDINFNYEGGFCGELLFENNEITGCGFDSNFFSNSNRAVVTITAVKERSQPVDTEDLHRNLIIRGNRISRSPRGFYFSNTDGLIVEENLFEPPAGQIHEEFPMIIRNSRRIELWKNRSVSRDSE
jgi:hypothetical protein